MNYVEEHQLGEVMTSEIGFRLTTNPDTVRAPDVFFLSNARLQERGEPQGFYPGAPDLVVEVVDVNDTYMDVNDSILDWLEHGTQLVYVVNPPGKRVTAFRPDRTGVVLDQDGVLSGEDVVPGWSMSVRELFEQD